MNIISKIKQNKIKSIVIFVLAIFIIRFIIGIFSPDKIDTVTIESKSFVKTVSVAGKVVPANDVELGFENTGKISNVSADVGDSVYAGQVLASLTSDDVYADLLKAKADLEAEKIKLNQIDSGLGSVSSDITFARNKLYEAIKDAYIKSDDAVRNSVYQFYDDSPRKIIFAFDDYSLKLLLDQKQVDIEKMFNEWEELMSSITKESFIDTDVDLAEQNLKQVRDFLDKVSLAVNDFQASEGFFTQTEINGFKTDVSNARISINEAINNLISVKDDFRNAKTDSPYQKARVASYEAVVKSLEANLNKLSIRAPFSGVVTKSDAKVGLIVSANTPIITLATANFFQIETFVPEINVKDVAIDNIAKVTLDAYGENEVFEAKVLSIDPAETLKDGVSSYKVKFVFLTDSEKFKSGMTANVEIKTEEKPDSILISQDSIIKKNGFSYVKVLVGSETVEKLVTTGSVASSGEIEIISGLSIGEKVILVPKED